MTRRECFGLLPALAGARSLLAQADLPQIPARALNHMALRVKDARRSAEFYQGLFGMPVQSRQSNSMQLRIGPGPQYVSVGTSTEPPGIDHFCLTVNGFNLDRIAAILAQHRVDSSDSRGALKTWVRKRDETTELYVGDPDGITVQVQDASYCGGTGALGNQCFATPEPAPGKGLITLRAWSHFTLAVSNPEPSQNFYQNLFSLRVQAYQGATPALGIGSGREFLMAFKDAASPRIHHACFLLDDFQPDRVLKTLAEFGIKPRGAETGPVPPLVSFVTLRKPDRGGAPGGTPELYFTDPDGILLQLQDVKYCGGGGYLGDECRG